MSIARARSRFVTASAAKNFAEMCRLQSYAVGTVFAQRDITGPEDIIDFAPALSLLSKEVDATYGRRGIGLRIAAGATPITVHKAQRLAVIATELISNAYTHAFVGRRFGAIEVGTSPDPGRRGRLWVADSGIGFDPRRLPKEGGWQLVDAIAKTLNADIIHADAHPGARVEMSFCAM